jgi:hypothetical protein
MEIVRERPPLYLDICKVFPGAAGKGVVFAWGDKIYLPDGGSLPSHILEHEKIHGGRQVLLGVEKWWREYLEREQFRLDEEVLGHRAEYRDLCQQSADRERRNAYLHYVAAKLASPLYGRMVTQREARQLVAGR